MTARTVMRAAVWGGAGNVFLAVALAALPAIGMAQTRIDLRTQAKSVDFSSAASTSPSATGTTLPATCTAGQTFIKTSALLGQNWYICTAANQWTVQGIELPALTGSAGVLSTDGSSTFWKTFGGDVSGTADALSVNRILGRSLSLTAPLSGQVLAWNGTQWAPQTINAGVASAFGRTGAVTAQTGDYTFAQIGGTLSASQVPATGGDLSGQLTAATVVKLQGRPVGATTPVTGQALVWNGSQWAPQTINAGVTSAFGRTGAVTAQTGDYTFAQIGGTVSGSQLPAAGGDLLGTLTAATVTQLQGRPISVTAPSAGQALVWSGSQWTPQTVSGSGGVTSAFGRTGAVTAQAGDYAFSQIGGTVSGSQLPAAGGDLSGTLTAATVTKLQGWAVGATAPSTGQFLGWNGTQWTPQAAPVTSVFGRTGAVTAQTGDYTFAQIGGTVSGSQLPAAGGDLSGTLSSATVTKLQGRAVGTTVPGTGQFLGWNGTQWAPQAAPVTSLFGRTGAVTAQTGDYTFAQIGGTVSGSQLPAAGGDLSGTLTAATVAKLQGSPVAATAPSTGQFLGWSGTQWAPLMAPVTSLFGRTGAVTAQTGDYTFAQIGGTVSGSQLPALGGDLSGAVTSASVTALQGWPVATAPPSTGQVLTWSGTQWTAESLNTSPGNYAAALNGVTSITIPGAVHRLGTANLLVQCYDNASPANEVEPNGVTIDPGTYDVTIAFATAQSGQCVINGDVGGAGGAGGGAGMGSQLGDFAVTRTSATTLTIGAGCARSTPCNERIGSQVFSIMSSATVTLSAGSGMAFVYLDSTGTLTVGHSMTASCSGCTALSGVTSFPVNTIPLFTWTATNGVWDSSGGTDRRGWLSGVNIASGPGIVAVQAAGQTTLSVDSASVPGYLSGSATLDFPLIEAGTCSADLTISLPGANVGDAVVAGWPGGLEAGLTGLMRVSAPGVVSVRLCASGAGAVDPASATFQALIVRSF
jgi:hypothetical protein